MPQPSEPPPPLALRLKVRADDLRTLHKVVQLPWALTLGDRQIVDSAENVVVARFGNNASNNQLCFLLDAAHFCTFLFAAEAEGLVDLGVPKPPPPPDPLTLACAVVGEAALAYEAARLAVIEHDAESDRIGSENLLPVGQRGHPEAWDANGISAHRFWRDRGIACGELIRARDDAALALAQAAALFRAQHPEKGPTDGGG